MRSLARIQRAYAKGAVEFADVIVEDLKARPDQREYAHAISEIQLIQDSSETALEAGICRPRFGESLIVR